MAKVLTGDAELVCSHQGSLEVTATQRTLLVRGVPVLVAGDVDGKPVSGCKLQSPATPCSAVVSTVAGIATVLRAAEQPVLLDTATGVTNSVPPGTWQVRSAGQSTLDAS
jgi:hypothetical protein